MQRRTPAGRFQSNSARRFSSLSSKRLATVAPGVAREGSLRRQGTTAVHQEYGMWVMPISAFIELDKLQPHQVLRASGKIVPYDKSMSTIFFLSHQCVVCCVSLATLTQQRRNNLTRRSHSSRRALHIDVVSRLPHARSSGETI